MRPLLLSLVGLFLLATPALLAQHCGFDFSATIVVQPRDSATGEVIRGLRLTLIDSAEVPLKPGESEPTFDDFTNGDLSGEEIHYSSGDVLHQYLWFMNGSYALISGFNEGVRVKIEDPGNRGDGVYYDPVTITIDPSDIHPLCTNHTDWHRGPKGEFGRTFHPVVVYLARNQRLR